MNLRELAHSSESQTFCLFGALFVSQMMLIFPDVVFVSQGRFDLLAMLLLPGVCAGFVFGYDVKPRNRLMAKILGPYTAWLLMNLGLLYVLLF